MLIHYRYTVAMGQLAISSVYTGEIFENICYN